MGTSLNPITARWLDDAPGPRVDCGACARFGKCCDFQPFVPNVLAGAMLDAGVTLPPSAKYVRQPLGLVPARAFRRARDARDRAPATAADDLCAFLAGGRCTIWAWRPGECSTYTCLGSPDGLAARAFAFETELAQMALVEQGFGAAAVSAQIDILNDPGDHLGHEVGAERVYRRAWDWARGLSRADLAQWMEDI